MHDEVANCFEIYLYRKFGHLWILIRRFFFNTLLRNRSSLRVNFGWSGNDSWNLGHDSEIILVKTSGEYRRDEEERERGEEWKFVWRSPSEIAPLHSSSLPPFFASSHGLSSFVFLASLLPSARFVRRVDFYPPLPPPPIPSSLLLSFSRQLTSVFVSLSRDSSSLQYDGMETSAGRMSGEY